MRSATLLSLVAICCSRTVSTDDALPDGKRVAARRPADHTAGDSVFMERLSWRQVGDAIKRGYTTVIIATGGVEQNGPNVATGKHNYVVQAMAQSIAHELGKTLVAPVVKFVPEGSIDPPTGHMKYPGTISLSQATYKLLLLDICRSMKQHGFKDVVLIGDSGGNQEGMREVAIVLNNAWSNAEARVHYIPEYYRQDKWSAAFLRELGINEKPAMGSASHANVHSNYHYEAILATVGPELIRAHERIANGTFTIHGVSLEPLELTVANGKKLVQYRTGITVAAIRKAMEEVGSGR